MDISGPGARDLLLLDRLVLAELPVTTPPWTGGHTARELADELLHSHSQSAIGTIEAALFRLAAAIGALNCHADGTDLRYGLTPQQRAAAAVLCHEPGAHL